MKFSHVSKLSARKKASALLIPCWEGNKKNTELAASVGSLDKELDPILTSGDFKGKLGESIIVYLPKQPEKRFLLVGLGKKEKCSVEMLRRAYGSVGKFCLKNRYEDLNLVLPEKAPITEDEAVRGISEGLLSINYNFTKLKSETLKENPPTLIKKVQLIGGKSSVLKEANKRSAIAEGVYLARDLANGNADDVTAPHLGQLATSMGKKDKKLKVTVFDKKRIQKEKMGLLLAVNRGSNIEPRLIVVEYKGNPKSKEKTVIIGKGVTYDTGGLNLKPTGYMETMKADMCGAAACFGIITAVKNLGLKENVTIVIPSTENSIGSHSFKPGDVYTSYLGKTVEIGNTDAEGRLILADAIAYACKVLKPTRIVDFATLTGAVDIALGSEATGVMGNNSDLIEALKSAGERTFERLWQLPLYEEYRDHLKSDVADMKNIGKRSAGTCVAAMFLQEFLDKDIPWAHCDIASTAYLDHPMYNYLPKYGTGVGVRLILDFLENKGSAKK